MVLLISIILWTVVSSAPVDNYQVTRDYFGDVFTLSENECVRMGCDTDGRFAAPVPSDGCMCQCAPSHYIYRDDIEDCVEYIAECPLAIFLRPYMAEKLPVVSLPLTGQLVYPGAQFQFPGIGNITSLSTCEVSTTEYMTNKGWVPVTQDSINEPVFGVFQDGGNTFLQWLGKDNQRVRLQHHLVLIRLRCQDQGRTFDSCSALRIGWSPGLNVALTEPFWIRRNNFIIIGLCVGILGLTYVFAICIYMKVRRKKTNKCTSEHIGSRQSAFRDLRNNKDPRKCPRIYKVRERDMWANHKNCLKAEKYPSSVYFTGRKPKEGETEIETNNNDYLARQNFVLSKEYFEPEMLASPPPLATELLHRVRQTISLTMRRIKNLKYRPTLVIIPEDDYFYPDDHLKFTSSSPEIRQEFNNFEIANTSPTSNLEQPPTPQPPPRKCRSKRKLNDKGSESGKECSNHLTKFDQFREDLYQKVNKINDLRNGLDTVHVLEGEEEAGFDGPAAPSSGSNRISRRMLLTNIEAGIDIDDSDDDDGISSSDDGISASDQDEDKSQNNDLEEIIIDDNNTNSPFDIPEKEANDLIEDYLSIDIEELYRQWSSQVALKLLEQKVPNIDCNIEAKETNALTQFLKECKNAFGRLGHLNPPKSHDVEAQIQSDNWTLRKEGDSEHSSKMSDASTFRLDSLTDFSESSIEGQTSQDSLANSEELRPEVDTSGVSSGGDEPQSLETNCKTSARMNDILCLQQSVILSENASSIDADSLEDSENSPNSSSAEDASDTSSNDNVSFSRGSQNLEVRRELKAAEWNHICEKKHQNGNTRKEEEVPQKVATGKKRKSLLRSRRPTNGTCKDYIQYCKSFRTGVFTPCNLEEANKCDAKSTREHCLEDGYVTLIGIAPS